MKDIFNSHPVSVLKAEISKTNRPFKGYSKMKKVEIVDLMMKNKERFSYIKMAEKKVRKAPVPKKPEPKPEPKKEKPKMKPAPKKEEMTEREKILRRDYPTMVHKNFKDIEIYNIDKPVSYEQFYNTHPFPQNLTKDTYKRYLEKFEKKKIKRKKEEPKKK